MGSIYGARLSVHDEVTLIDTNSTLVDKINKDGVILEEAGVEQVFHPAAAVSVAGLGKMDLVILFTKSLYSDAALKAASPAFGPDTYILTLQNGMGHEEVLSHYVDLDHVLIGTTEDNGRVVEAAHVHHGGTGVTNIGLGKGRDDVMRSRLEASFKAAGFKPVFHEDIRQLVWDKLMVNATLSALTAILQCDIHYIASDSYAWSLCSAMIDECVMTACGEGLSFETLAAVKEAVGDMPLVLHGGTGIPDDQITKAISLGVAKINVNTECQLVFAEATRKYIEAGKDQQGKGFDPRKLLAPGAEAIKAKVKEKMELFGSVGKA